MPSAIVLIWSIVSILLLLGGIGGLVWYYVRQYDLWRTDLEPETGYAKEDFLTDAAITPSMRATAKYFWVVTVLFAAQVLQGIITAHYAVEGQGLYGLPMVGPLPYVITRTCHTQLAVLWITTAWLATGLYVAPLLSGHEPKFQRYCFRHHDRFALRRRADVGGQHTHISIMEYWRWWVVHLWGEGIFEVFATAIISTLFVRMGILRVSVAATMILFATMNIGLAMMTFLSLLPQGLWQTYASIKHGYAYARSAEFMHSTLMEAFVWARVTGDLVFGLGVFAFAAFVPQAFSKNPD